MRAVILAGGKGTRLAPYTTVLPKPLIPIGDMPILEVVLRQLQAAGVRRVTMAVGYLAELLQAFFQDGNRLDLVIDYSIEEEPLGTVGPLAMIPDLEGSFLTMNGDILCDLDYAALAQFHREQGAAATIATYHRQVKIDFGVIESDNNGRITDIVEKPSYDYQVSMGIYMFDAAILHYIETGKYFDFPNLIKLLIARGEKVCAFPFSGYWLDMGRHDDYAQAVEEFEAKRDLFLPEAPS